MLTLDDRLTRTFRSERMSSRTDLLAYGDAAYLLAYRITGNSADAEDVVQDAYLRALRHAAEHTLPEGDELRKWFLRVVANAAKDFRSAKQSRQAREKTAMSESTPSAAPHQGQDVLRDAIAEALNGLDESLRVPVCLHYEQGLSYAEAAEVLGAPEGTLRKYASRGIELLREKLARQGHVVAPALITATLAKGLGIAAPASLAASVSGLVAGGALPAAKAAATATSVAGATAATGLTVKLVVAAVLVFGACTAVKLAGTGPVKPLETGGEKETASAADPEHLKAVASAWLSSYPGEENTSCGKGEQFKLKTYQECALLRFENGPRRGREVASARLFLKPAGPIKIRYLRLSTVNGDWTEGNGTKNYGPADGATFAQADSTAKRAWSWPGSEASDVIMTNGNTLACYGEIKDEADGWISVNVAPELIYALANNDTDGLAVLEGGTILLANNFFYSSHSKGNEPRLDITYGAEVKEAPAAPTLVAEGAAAQAHLKTGAAKIVISEAAGVACWKLKLDGKPVERWRVKHPESKGATTLVLEDLEPNSVHELETVAIARGGQTSEPTRVKFTSSPALPVPAEIQVKVPEKSTGTAASNAVIRAWAFPPLVKLSPEKPELICGDEKATEHPQNGNAVWNGKSIQLCGARGEIVSYQLCIEKLGEEPLSGVTVTPQELSGPGGVVIGVQNIELFKNWYAQNSAKQWQPAYGVPLPTGHEFSIPDPKRTLLPKQQNQSLYVDLFIPKTAAAGAYAGNIVVRVGGENALTLPVALTVFDFTLPDELSFRPELNAYSTPAESEQYYRLAQQHRCVLNIRDKHQPIRLTGSGKNVHVIWDEYDQYFGQMFSGDLFAGNHRAGMPLESLYLPYHDNWPTVLTQQTYNYAGHWPGKGESTEFIHEHSMKAPPIETALSQDYKDAFVAVEKQFIEHFKARGWTQTEMQMIFDGKDYQRLDFGANYWFTTDEPSHWNDWLAVRFFCKLWSDNRGGADARIWPARADISRPQWQAATLDGVVNTVYFGTGGFSSPAMARRCETLAAQVPLKCNAYGGCNADNTSNTKTVAILLNAWLHGSEAFTPWQTLGNTASLDTNDENGNGNSLLAPARRLGPAVVADIRLKAMRDGEQLIEYLNILAQRNGLNREQLRAMLLPSLNVNATVRAGANADDADALEASTIEPWRMAELRQRVADLIAKGESAEVLKVQSVRLEKGSADEKIGALKSVSQTGNPELLNRMIALTADADVRVRIAAASTLLKRGDVRGVAPLLEILNGKELDLRTAAYWPLKIHSRTAVADAAVQAALTQFEKERAEAVKQASKVPLEPDVKSQDF